MASTTLLFTCAAFVPRLGPFGLGDAERLGEPWFDGTYLVASVVAAAGLPVSLAGPRSLPWLIGIATGAHQSLEEGRVLRPRRLAG